MAKASEKYEVMYIINPNFSEEETAAVVEKFKALVEANGTLEELEEMGKRKLAYEINYISEGYYVLMKFTSGPDFPAELDRILGITDGISQMLLDFSILGEKGRKGNYGMSRKELSRRYTTERDEDIAIQRRIDEYSMSKIDLTIEMICRAIKHKIRFRYVLADSWFTCAKIVRFIRSRHIKCDYIGMIKVGEEGKTKYRFERKDLTAPAIIKKLNKRSEKKYSRKLKCWYICADVVFADTQVRLFFIRRSKRGPWNGLLTTDLSLGFFEAYKIYSRRWSQEVIFKESKGLLGLGKCQSANFAAQIASTSIVALQYNILSAVKRFIDYETIGELFRQVTQDSHELTISERIWQAILELVDAITKVFSIDDEEVLDALVNESDELAHICELYQCKMAS